MHLSGVDNIKYIEFGDESRNEDEAYYALKELLSIFKWRNVIKVLLLPNELSGLRSRLVGTIDNLVLVTQDELHEISRSENPIGAFRDLMRAQLELGWLNPYQYKGPVTGNRFFGRDAQLRAIITRPEISYLVSGTRASGKTSLLLEAKRRLEETHDGDWENTIYIDCARYVGIAGIISSILMDTGNRTSFANVDKWESPARWVQFYRYLRTYTQGRSDRRLHLFFDEYDTLQQLELASEPGASFTWGLRSMKSRMRLAWAKSR